MRGRKPRVDAGPTGFHLQVRHSADRDPNAAVNLARWAASTTLPRSPDPQAGGRVTNARRRDGAGQHPACWRNQPG